jgi:hypothetical protein
MVHQYEPGDIVVSAIIEEKSFTGIVRDVQPKLNKILVAWGGGSVVQHDPDEIMLYPELELLKNKMAIVASDSGMMARRVRGELND